MSSDPGSRSSAQALMDRIRFQEKRPSSREVVAVRSRGMSMDACVGQGWSSSDGEMPREVLDQVDTDGPVKSFVVRRLSARIRNGRAIAGELA